MILGSSTLRQPALLLFLSLALQLVFAQQQAVTAADYARAEKLCTRQPWPAGLWRGAAQLDRRRRSFLVPQNIARKI